MSLAVFNNSPNNNKNHCPKNDDAEFNPPADKKTLEISISSLFL